MPVPDASRTQIRWLIRRDMDEVLTIERNSFQFAWNEEEFLCCLRQRNCIGTVAELDHKIVGFM
ncbi:MAG: ribosomal-protein-alanine N-acetyltransferase RimI, partial [Planctomycetaceae bacterium]|nr:ribosomal-protein-alanine N-acetyltransferase RimI [Planctomycetaceae bacterium]